VLEQSSSTGNRPDDGVFAIGKNGFGDFNGYIDELRLSSVARYGGTSFTEPTANYAVDGDTNSLLHFDGTNGSTDIINETDRGVIVEADANVSVTGLEATAAVGEVTVAAGADVQVTGLEAVGGVGEVHVGIFIKVPVTGVEANAQVGAVTIDAQANIEVTGVEATGLVNPVLVWGRIAPNQNPGYTPIEPSSTPAWSDETPSQTPNWDDIAA
jgi:hypothetical protein